MKATSVDLLREDVMSVGAVILKSPLVHPTGVPLHPEGTLLTIPRMKALREAGFTQLFLLEPGETVESARRALSVETLPLARIRPGDRLAEPLGPAIASAGAVVDEALLEAARRAGVEQAAIRTRGLEHAVKLVLEYVGSLPPTEVPEPAEEPLFFSEPPVVPLIVPRAKVAVSLRSGEHRSLVCSTLQAQGHEAKAVTAAADLAQIIRLQQADVVVLDAADAGQVRPLLLDPAAPKTVSVLALATELKGADLLKVLQCGVSDVIPSPRADLILEKVLGGLQATGRRLKTAPAVRSERRAAPRTAESMPCRLVDLLGGGPLPVAAPRLLDRSEGGARIEYRPPERKDFQWVRSRTVHPLHFLHAHAQDNGLGNDLLLSAPAASPDQAPLEVRARVAWIELRKDREEAGLIFRKGMTTIRRSRTP